jgi:hypothetical protein
LGLAAEIRDGLISKPFELTELATRLREVLSPALPAGSPVA